MNSLIAKSIQNLIPVQMISHPKQQFNMPFCFPFPVGTAISSCQYSAIVIRAPNKGLLVGGTKWRPSGFPGCLRMPAIQPASQRNLLALANRAGEKSFTFRAANSRERTRQEAEPWTRCTPFSVAVQC